MKLEVVTPHGATVDADEVTEVIATGVLGEFGIRPGHRPFMSALKPGRLVFEKGETLATYAADRGYLEVDEDIVRVITETCVTADEVDADKERATIASAEQASTKEGLGDAARRQLDYTIARARARLALLD